MARPARRPVTAFFIKFPVPRVLLGSASLFDFLVVALRLTMLTPFCRASIQEGISLPFRNPKVHFAMLVVPGLTFFGRVRL